MKERVRSTRPTDNRLLLAAMCAGDARFDREAKEIVVKNMRYPTYMDKYNCPVLNKFSRSVLEFVNKARAEGVNLD